jgi:drug/metabolite transporter (DMT)-like permease
MERHAPVIVLVLSSVLWGLDWLPLKLLNEAGAGTLMLALVAYAMATLVVLPWAWRQREAWRRRPRALLLILTLGGYANLAFVVALIHGEVVRVMVLFYLLPVWAMLGARLFLGERLDGARLLAVSLALFGAVLVLGGPAVLEGQFSVYDLIAVSCGIAFAGNNLVYRAEQSVPVASKLGAELSGCVFFAAIALWLLVDEPGRDADATTWAWVAAYGVGWLLLATAATQWAVTHMQAGRAAVIIILELVVAVITAVWIGGERLSSPEWAGALLIAVAALIEARRPETDPRTLPTL